MDPVEDMEVEEALASWLRQVERLPLLRPEEEIQLAQRIEEGDDEAYHRMVESNLRLVLRVAQKYARVCQEVSLSLEDLIQEGNIGLMIAARRYDYRHGNRFSTYALYWIQQAISRAVAEKGRAIRLPVHLTDTLHQVNRANQRLLQRLGRPPTLAELAGELGLPEQKLAFLLLRTGEPVSMDTAFETEEGQSRLADYLPDRNALSPDEAVFQASLREQVERLLTRLSSREQNVLRLRFGLDDGETHTLQEVSHHLGLSRERVRQIEKQALRKLRQDKFAINWLSC